MNTDQPVGTEVKFRFTVILHFRDHAAAHGIAWGFNDYHEACMHFYIAMSDRDGKYDAGAMYDGTTEFAGFGGKLVGCESLIPKEITNG